MSLSERDGYWYGDERADIAAEVGRYSLLNGYEAQHFAEAKCSCGLHTFVLALDDTQGAAVRSCASCNKEHAIGDSADYLDEAELEECACPCGNEHFEITVGVALHRNSEDVRWLYVGCRCTACGLTAVYGDWKNEFTGYRALLARV